jgi:hypothetical protein
MGSCRTGGLNEKFECRNLNGRESHKVVGADGNVMSKWIPEKQGVKVWTGSK